MSDIFYSLVLYSFLAFPPILLIMKLVTRKPSGRFLVLLVVLYALLGWSLIFIAHVEEQSHIYELLDQGRYEELPSGWDSDGGKGVMALFLGWIFPLVYFMAWLVVYAVAAIIRSLFNLEGKRAAL